MCKWRGYDGRYCKQANARSVTPGKCQRRRSPRGYFLRNLMKVLVKNNSGQGIPGRHLLRVDDDDDLSVAQLHAAIRRLLPELSRDNLWVQVWNADFERWVTVNNVRDDVPREQARLQVALAPW
jgi:hypothetical protein